MRKFFHLFVALAMMTGTLPVPSLSAPLPPEDCLICGHACCCPEMCAPKLNELKKKKVQACDQPLSVCGLTTPDTPAALHLLESSAMIKPRIGLLALMRPDTRNNSELLPERQSFASSPRFEETPTPPPRLRS